MTLQLPKESGKQQRVRRDKAKKLKKVVSTRRDSASDLSTSVARGGYSDVIEQNLKQLKNYTKLFLEQQTEGVDKFVEIESIKHASETDKKEYFKMVTEHTTIMQCYHLLESKIREQEFVKRLDLLNDTIQLL